MTVYASGLGGPKPQFLLSTGLPAVGYKLFSYVAGSVGTKLNTYTDNTGGSANTNPIILNSLGEPSTQVWLTSGSSYKFVLAPSTDTDPPTSPVWTVDGVAGINDVSISGQSEWALFGGAPTYVSATQFTLSGDQTTTFTPGRRLKTTNTIGTVYSTITVSAFGALTTVTVENDANSLDAGLSAVSYAILAADNPSVPPFISLNPVAVDSTTRTKRLKLTLSGLTASTTRVGTVPDSNFNLGSPRGYIDGLTLSTAGGSATMGIAIGLARDSTNVADLILASAFTKTTSAWAVGTGNGAMDTGAVANTTTYHWFLIMRPDTGLVDVLFSLSATAPTMPANYTYKRRIGTMRTNGSAQWQSFTQDGDLFQLWVPVNDVGTTNPGTSAVTTTLTSIPTGINIIALIAVDGVDTTPAAFAGLVTDLATTDTAPAITIQNFRCLVAGDGIPSALQIRTNTSAQVRYRINASTANTVVRITSFGWIDQRNKNQ